MHKVIFSAATALTLAVVFTGAASAYVPGFGCGYSGCNPSPSPTPISVIKVENSDTRVLTAAKSIADTGENMQLGGVKQLMFTGNATSRANASAQVNTSLLSLPNCLFCSPSGDVSLKVENTNTTVLTGAKSVADTGENMQVAGKTTSIPSWRVYKKPSTASSSQMMFTGVADSRGEAGSNVNYVGLGDLTID